MKTILIKENLIVDNKHQSFIGILLPNSVAETTNVLNLVYGKEEIYSEQLEEYKNSKATSFAAHEDLCDNPLQRKNELNLIWTNDPDNTYIGYFVDIENIDLSTYTFDHEKSILADFQEELQIKYEIIFGILL